MSLGRMVLVAAACAVAMAVLAGCAAPGRGDRPATTDTGPSSASAPASTALAAPSPAASALPLQPEEGHAYFGVNLDWGSDSVAGVSERLGVVPAVYVAFVPLPLDAGSAANLDAAVEQVRPVGGSLLVTIEPHEGLASVTPEVAAALAERFAGYGSAGVPVYVRFAHEMNGSWYPWSQQPAEYVAAFRLLADALHATSPRSATVWAPNHGAGYPFPAGEHRAAPGTPAFEALDTDGSGDITQADDPYAPYYPGDEAVDWVGMSLYHWGHAYPWGENEVPEEGKFAGQLTGEWVGRNGDERDVPDFYAEYAEARSKPLAITETAALWDPAAPAPPSEADVKVAWWRQVFGESTRERFPRIGMINWFEWRKHEVEVDAVIDWRISADAQLARTLLAEVPAGWLRFAGE